MDFSPDLLLSAGCRPQGDFGRLDLNLDPQQLLLAGWGLSLVWLHPQAQDFGEFGERVKARLAAGARLDSSEVVNIVHGAGQQELPG